MLKSRWHHVLTVRSRIDSGGTKETYATYSSCIIHIEPRHLILIQASFPLYLRLLHYSNHNLQVTVCLRSSRRRHLYSHLASCVDAARSHRGRNNSHNACLYSLFFLPLLSSSFEEALGKVADFLYAGTLSWNGWSSQCTCTGMELVFLRCSLSVWCHF